MEAAPKSSRPSAASSAKAYHRTESTTTPSAVPAPCPIIRTAGEMRLSNFPLWQGAYAEFVSAPVCWPDFDVHDIDEALLAFSQRKRRFGGLLPEEVDSPSPTNGGNGARPRGRRPPGPTH